MKVKTALFKNLRGSPDYYSAFTFEPGHGYYQVSEWVEIDYPELSADELAGMRLSALGSQLKVAEEERDKLVAAHAAAVLQ